MRARGRDAAAPAARSGAFDDRKHKSHEPLHCPRPRATAGESLELSVRTAKQSELQSDC